jgi:hypothetical protein
MPKEIIHSATNQLGEGDSFRAEVGWSRDGVFVQLATTSGDIHDAAHVSLDRPAINNLIRVLRRARDQAFGRDE